jgi:glycosyltransferase involved in cell wall biosynthesis
LKEELLVQKSERRNDFDKPFISVIIAVYNGADTMRNCIDSVVNQTYQNKELIIIDGGSTDGTEDILKENAGNIAYWESKKDRGIAHAWNKALGKATGDWVIFIGSDDKIANENVFSDMCSHLSVNTTADVVYGKLIFRAEGRKDIILGGEWDEKKFRRRMTIPHPAAFQKRSCFNKVGTFDESYRIALDYELLLRVHGLKCKHVNSIVTIMAASGLSSTQYTKSLFEAYRAQRAHGVLSPPAALIWLIYYSIKSNLNKSR